MAGTTGRRRARAEGSRAKPKAAAPIVPLTDEAAEIAKGAEAFKAAGRATVTDTSGDVGEAAGRSDGANEAGKKLPDPVPGNDGDALARIAESFRKRFPEDWENIKLCPLLHGLDHMADVLRLRD